MDALAVDNLFGAPNTVGEAILLDLEPATTDTRVGGRVVDLLEVGNGRTLVGAVHDVVRSGTSRAEHIAPDSSDFVSSTDIDDSRSRGGRVWSAIAGHGVGGHIFDGSVVRRDTDTVALAVIGAASNHMCEDGVGISGGCRHEREEQLHDVELGSD